MRLINCSTNQLEEFFGDSIPRYAILSHTWGKDEATFADFTRNPAAAVDKEGYRKIAFTCKQALKDGISYAWIDTCCIDKSSSAELSEAINSMFNWYQLSAVCYAFMSDVSQDKFDESFPESRWFTRGWTLQELLAPDSLIFYDHAWNALGTKAEHVNMLSEITYIDKAALLGTRWASGHELEGSRKVHLGSFCVAKRMSWASHRVTTRVEDIAYCLLGIFDINMPLLYGEGSRAFTRLQEEIIKRSNDDSILAWDLYAPARHPLGLVPDPVMFGMKGSLIKSSIFASSPIDFKDCRSLERAANSTSTFTMTNLGLQIEIPLVPVWNSHPKHIRAGQPNHLGWIGLLSCSPGSLSDFVCIPLCRTRNYSESNETLQRIGTKDRSSGFLESSHAVTVGPRAAAQATVRKVTIVRYDNHDDVREGLHDRRQIITNAFRSIRRRGYSVINGEGYWMGAGNFLGRYKTNWDMATMTLTVESGIRALDLLSFTFGTQGSKSYSTFTLFVRTDYMNSLAVLGSSFSKADKERIFEYLESKSQQANENEEVEEEDEDEDRLTIKDKRGARFHVVATIQAKTVHHWQMFTIGIDAVPVQEGDRHTDKSSPLRYHAKTIAL